MTGPERDTHLVFVASLEVYQSCIHRLCRRELEPSSSQSTAHRESYLVEWTGPSM